MIKIFPIPGELLEAIDFLTVGAVNEETEEEEEKKKEEKKNGML